MHVIRPTHGSGQHLDDDRDHAGRPVRRAVAGATAPARLGTDDVATLSAPRGRIPYGYRRVFDTATRRLVSLEPEPTAAAVVREIATRYALGELPVAIVADLNRDSVRSPSGVAPWRADIIRRLATSPVYVGEAPRSQRERPADVEMARWPALIPRELHEQCVNRIEQPSLARLGRPSPASHLLSFIMTCGVCGGVTTTVSIRRGGGRPPRPSYVCKAHAHAVGPQYACDAAVRAVMLAYLHDPSAAVGPTPTADDGTLRLARGVRSDAYRDRSDLDMQLGRGSLTVDDYRTISGTLDRRITSA
ncbi:MAG TPA: recombinase family protein, partial [Micromonosporaceae bacterium]